MEMSHFMDSLFSGGTSQDDARFRFGVGDVVIVSGIHPNQKHFKVGEVYVVTYRRNGYPPPFFSDCWFPLYNLKPFGVPDYEGRCGGELGEGCLMKRFEVYAEK